MLLDLFFLIVSSFLSLVPHVVLIFLRQSLHGEVLKKNELDKWGH